MDALELLRQNLLSPMVLAFFLGVVARLLRSDLAFPEAMYTALSIYLLFAIGLKGGVELAKTPLALLLLPLLATLFPLCGHRLCGKRLGGAGGKVHLGTPRRGT